MSNKFEELLNEVIKRHGTKVTRNQVRSIIKTDKQKYCTSKTFLAKAKKLERGVYSLANLSKETKKVIPSEVRKSPKKLLNLMVKSDKVNNYFVEEEMTPFDARYEL